MAHNRKLRREGARLFIEARALLKWYKSGGNEVPNPSKIRHYALLSLHKYGAGCCGWNHYIKICNSKRILAIYSVDDIYNPNLRKISRVPIEIVDDTASSLEDYFKWEDEQDELNARACETAVKPNGSHAVSPAKAVGTLSEADTYYLEDILAGLHETA